MWYTVHQILEVSGDKKMTRGIWLMLCQKAVRMKKNPLLRLRLTMPHRTKERGFDSTLGMHPYRLNVLCDFKEVTWPLWVWPLNSAISTFLTRELHRLNGTIDFAMKVKCGSVYLTQDCLPVANMELNMTSFPFYTAQDCSNSQSLLTSFSLWKLGFYNSALCNWIVPYTVMSITVVFQNWSFGAAWSLHSRLSFHFATKTDRNHSTELPLSP